MTIAIEINQRVETARVNFEYQSKYIAIRKFLSSAGLTFNCKLSAFLCRGI